MKKFKLMTVLFLLGFALGQAQVLKLGAKAGLNYANFSGSDLQTDAITSYHAGLSAQIKLGDKFSVQPEIIYSTQGASYTNLNQELNQKLGYMSVPILARIQMGKIFSF